jgi:hypothetical protein
MPWLLEVLGAEGMALAAAVIRGQGDPDAGVQSGSSECAARAPVVALLVCEARGRLVLVVPTVPS